MFTASNWDQDQHFLPPHYSSETYQIVVQFVPSLLMKGCHCTQVFVDLVDCTLMVEGLGLSFFPLVKKVEVKNKHWNQKNGDNGQCEIFLKWLNRDSKSGYTWWRNGTKPEGDFNLEHEHWVGGSTVWKSPPIFFFPFLFFFEISSELDAEREGISLQMNMQNCKQLSKL